MSGTRQSNNFVVESNNVSNSKGNHEMNWNYNWMNGSMYLRINQLKNQMKMDVDVEFLSIFFSFCQHDIVRKSIFFEFYLWQGINFSYSFNNNYFPSFGRETSLALTRWGHTHISFIHIVDFELKTEKGREKDGFAKG